MAVTGYDSPWWHQKRGVRGECSCHFIWYLVLFPFSNPNEWENTLVLGNVVAKKPLKCWTHRRRFWGTNFSWPANLPKRIVMLWPSRSFWATPAMNPTHPKPKVGFIVCGFGLFWEPTPLHDFFSRINIFMFFPQDPVLNDLYAVFRGIGRTKKSMVLTEPAMKIQTLTPMKLLLMRILKIHPNMSMCNMIMVINPVILS